LSVDELAVRRVAVVLFEDFTVLDAYGPIQAFGACRQTRSDGSAVRLFQIFTLGMRSGMVRSGQGPATQVDHTFADAPSWDVLLVPGGAGTRPLVEDKAFVASLRRASEQSAVTATVCTGSALLARTGLLDDRKATTNKIAWDWVVKQGPKVRWQRRARWVDDGNINSSSGVSAGTDMALALIARLNGHDMAIAAARHMEHMWNQDATNDPFA
jgi:transcriptional regulator GlxA family with amidase domain